MRTKLYVATCERCGSSVGSTEQPEACPYCADAAADVRSTRASRARLLWKWFLICAALGACAGLLR